MKSKLEEFLEQQNLSQRDLAFLADVHPSTVNRVIRGKETISRRKQLAWAKALQTDPRKLFDDGK